MANQIVPLPRSIERIKDTDSDTYTGSANELINAGVITREQLPPSGRMGITFQQGQPVRRFNRNDETSLRVEWRRDGLLTVRKALPSKTLAARLELERGSYKRWAEACAAEKAEREQLLADAGARAIYENHKDTRTDATKKAQWVKDWRGGLKAGNLTAECAARAPTLLRAAALAQLELMAWADHEITPQAKADARRVIERMLQSS